MKGAMSNLSGVARSHEQWARFRFSVIGRLLAAPPAWGELQGQLESLAAKKWLHPYYRTTGPIWSLNDRAVVSYRPEREEGSCAGLAPQNPF